MFLPLDRVWSKNAFFPTWAARLRVVPLLLEALPPLELLLELELLLPLLELLEPPELELELLLPEPPPPPPPPQAASRSRAAPRAAAT